jgi:Zn-dependent protease
MANHKCAVVTGAGSGIGRSTARLLARAGYNIVLVGRTRAKLEETAASLRDGPPHESLVLSADLTDPAAPRALVDHALAAFGRIDALACRSVGGRADTIILWPLGGVAFVSPPARPGALLWSIAAGPMVNLLLIPVTIGVALWGGVDFNHFLDQPDDLRRFLFMLSFINIMLFVFNMLPVYPLDGGQIFQSILWFFMSRSRSILIAAGVGLVCAVVGGAWAVLVGDIWLVVIAAFVAFQAFNGLRIARVLRTQEQDARDNRFVEFFSQQGDDGRPL